MDDAGDIRTVLESPVERVRRVAVWHRKSGVSCVERGFASQAVEVDDMGVWYVRISGTQADC